MSQIYVPFLVSTLPEAQIFRQRQSGYRKLLPPSEAT